jgi:hypothetical protein
MKRLARLPLLTLLAGISLAIGFFVPVFYEWTREPPSRSRLPALERASLASLLLTFVAWALVAWLSKPADEPQAAPRRKLQFGLRGLFAATTAVAVLVAVARWLDAPWSSGLVAAAAVGTLGWSLLRDTAVRWRTAALLACLFCPFVWMIAYNVPFGRTSGLVIAIPIAPGLLPAELIRQFVSGLGRDAMEPIAAVIVVGTLLLGAWLAGRGGKLLLAYLLLVLLVSSLSSLGMHALYRA